MTSLIMPSSLLQVANSLFQTCYNNWEQAVRRGYRRLVNRFVTICLQTCKNLCVFTYDARKNAQVVTNLQQICSNAVPTTCQQDVFALLVPSLLTTCYKVVEPNRLVTSCSNNLLSSCSSTICQQAASDNLVAT